MKATILTFENGRTEKLFDNMPIATGKKIYLGSHRPNGIVTKVSREK
jgi:hypothetical protein